MGWKPVPRPPKGGTPTLPANLALPPRLLMASTCSAPAATPLAAALSEARARIDCGLTRFTEFPSGCPPRLAEAIRYCLLAPGKRLRPTLVLWAAEACGCTAEAALPAACAVEMVHTYSLVHD